MYEEMRLGALGPEESGAKGAMAEEELLAYAPLVKQIAMRFALGLPPGLEVDDLIAYGSYGLLEAFRRYDPSRGVPFASFAQLRIRGAILDGLRAYQPLPEPARRQVRRMAKVREELTKELGREPETHEVARAMGRSAQEVEDLERMAGMLSMLSLEELLFAGPAEESTPEEEVIQEEEVERLSAALEHLTPRERQVLELVYYHDLNLSECAHVLGVSPSRVSQLHRRALLRLRSLLHPDEED